MKRRACGCCGAVVRKGLGRRAFVLDGAGLRAAVVCATCARRAVLLVTPEAAQVPRACGGCGKEVATIGPRCAERVGEHVRELSTANVVLAAAAAAPEAGR